MCSEGTRMQGIFVRKKGYHMVPFLTPQSGQVAMSENQRFQPRVCIQHVRACSLCTGKLEVCPVQIGRVPGLPCIIRAFAKCAESVYIQNA